VRIRRRFSAAGRLPDGLRARLEAESVLVAEEQLSAWLRLRGFRGPGIRVGSSLENVWVSLVVTRVRLLVWVGGADSFPQRFIDVPHGHELSSAIEVWLEPPDRLRFTTVLTGSYSGHADLGIRTAQAARLSGLLSEYGWHVSTRS